MKSPILSSRQKGFTLVELLVVISIIAALAGLTFGVVMRQVEKARQTASKNDCVNIAGAIESFYIDNNTFPVTMVPRKESTMTTAVEDPADMIVILLGREKGSARSKVNKSGQSYLTGSTVDAKIGGMYIDGSGAGFYDPWGSEYYVIMDTNGDGEIEDPTSPGRPIFNKKAIVYGVGPDTQGSAKDGKIRDKDVTEDNVYSWK